MSTKTKPMALSGPTTQKPQHSKSKTFVCSCLASSISYLSARIVGHPFETIKIRMQMSSRLDAGMLQIVQEAIAREGYFSFYKGVLQPIINVFPTTLSQFSTTEFTRRQLQEINPDMGIAKKNMIAGMAGGMISTCFLVTPDMLKSRAQMKKDGYIDYRKEVFRILRKEGFRGLFRGGTPLFASFVPAWGIYFCCYEKFKTYVTTKNQWLRTFGHMHAAGCSGIIAWIYSCPFDIIKNKQMTYRGKEPLTFMEAYQQLMAEGGLGKFTRGMSPMLIRGYIVAAIALPLYDYFLNMFLEEL